MDAGLCFDPDSLQIVREGARECASLFACTHTRARVSLALTPGARPPLGAVQEAAISGGGGGEGGRSCNRG